MLKPRIVRMPDLSPADQEELATRALRSKAAQEHRGACELCHAPDKELRPYGPRGELICFACGMKNEAATQRQFRRSAFGESVN